MTRQLSSASTLDHLKKEAKRWLKALRAGDVSARTRWLQLFPEVSDRPALRDVQHALAREYGFSGWTELKAKVAAIEATRESAGTGPLETLLRAAEQGDADAVGSILDQHPAIINERGVLDGHSGLRTALHFGVHHEPVVRVLLERGANPNIRDEGDNAFPLHFAAERGDLAIIRLLVEHGAETVAGEVDDHELDIIGWATAFSYLDINREVVEYLLAHGARHTMFSAVAMGEAGIIRERAARVPAAVNKPMDRTNHRRRPLHLAVVKKQPASLQALLDLGADVEATDADGLTALDQAALDGEAAMAQMLLDRGARLTVPAALFLRREAQLEALLREDTAALRPGGRYGALIVRAAAQGSADMIEALVRHGASVNVTDDTETAIDQTKGYTPLHAAAWEGNVAAAAVLLKHGADPRAREGKYCGTPAGWANYNKKFECRDLILQSDRIDIFDAINLDRPDLIRKILSNDPEALHRPFGHYASCSPEGAHITPLVFATFADKPVAVRVLGSIGAEFASGGHLANTAAERIAAFLRMACLDWAVGGPGRGHHAHAAERLLKKHPEIARHHLYTAVVCGAVDAVERRLAERPEAASEVGGPRGWPPILYLCSARLVTPGPWSDNAVRIARALLDRGADPNVYYEGGNPGIHYTCITCLVGRGEEQAPVHPKARELAALLLDRGAEPYDMQFFYNAYAGHASQRDLTDDDFVWLLELMYQRSLALGREADWKDPHWRMLDMGGYGGGAWYLLRNAMSGNYLRLAEWVLSHGASPNPPAASDPRTPTGTLYEQAVRTGRHEFAALLARYGATRTEPERLADDAMLFEAAEQNRVDVVASLLDQGLSPNLEQPRSRTRLLHAAAYNGAVAVVKLLIERAAEIDPRDSNHGTTPIYWAYWGRRPQCVDLLAPYSRDVWALSSAGKLDRLRELIAAEPRLAGSRDEHDTVLFYLPDDEQVAAEIVKLLLANGADPTVRRPDGTTAADVARARGLTQAADLLDAPTR